MEKEIKIALFSPASSPSVRKYQKGIKILKKNGISFESFVEVSESLPSLKARLLYKLITSREYKFIWSARGGFGSIKLIPYLEKIFVQNKKRDIYSILIGFSDITALHLYFYKKFKKPGIHAPMIVNLSDLSESAFEYLLEVIFKNKEIVLEGKTYQEGEAEGILLGGNLATLASLCGTPYLPFERSLILIIEDINEKEYRLERAFLQTIFTIGTENIKGIAMGNLGKVDPLKFLKRVEEFLPKKIPIGYAFPLGHVKDNFPFIIGQKTYLVVENKKAKLFQKNFIL